MIVALGLLVGLVLALTGAGGTIIAVPLLMFGLQLPLTSAAPIALFAVCTAAGVNTVLGLRARIVRYRAAALLATVGAAFTPLGLWLAHRLPPLPLALLFAAVLLYVALRMFRQADGGSSSLPCDPPCHLDPATGRLRWDARCWRTLSVAGAISGLLSGLLGVGGGFVIVPALRRTSDLSMPAIVASSLMAIALISAAAVLAAAATGHLQWALALPFAGATLAGMLLGRRMAARLSGPRLQRGFAVLMALVALGVAARALLG